MRLDNMRSYMRKLYNKNQWNELKDRRIKMKDTN